MMHEDGWMATPGPTIGALKMTGGFSAKATSVRRSVITETGRDQPLPASWSSSRKCTSLSAILPSSPRGVGSYQRCSGRSSGK